MLDFNEYQEKAHKTADYPSGTIGPEKHAADYLYPAMGLSEEAGEVSGKFAKAIRDRHGVIDYNRKVEIIKELGDVMWFVAELATCLDVKLEDVAQRNLDKLASRKERGVIHGEGDNR